MSFQQGLSGLSAASTNLDVIGNNIANVNTAGFKQSRAQFTDILSNSINGAGVSQVGIGAKVATIGQSFNQGNISMTNNPLDIAIDGQGFFRMSDNGAISYSRNGQFQLDEQGFLTDAKGLNLTGYMADAEGNVDSSKTVNLKLNTADLPPKVTSKFDWAFNLDSTEPPASVTTFDATNLDSFNFTKSGTIYDSLGNSHQLAIYFQKTATPNTWNTYVTVDGKVDDTTGAPVGINPSSSSLTFDGAGVLTGIDGAAAAPISVSVNLTTLDATLGAISPLVFDLDLTETTQFGSASSVKSNFQDGYSASRLAGFSTSPEGIIQGNYSNGESRPIAQVALANFINPQGLAAVGNGQWIETPSSGQPLVGAPKTGTLGVLQASAIEDANVDLTTELVKMITAQRMYQANAKSIETQDAVLQTLVNL
ncbi:flagellar hook protein FlgE [Nitrosomonas sp. JL21]|uniref:flagellar hook protein FlgE n=1 Tax=Nitrosomonas sp. JL21 TaxID=153949 RepID=UPI00136E5034|nr:flagellar hook protein FlgE [Nitrosomonas sp. JL21]MBL8498882.1 flagellar hook protein FlgE [Nitrosomonas sp.]MCC7091419.1 flagellar hook protein FlgE [Nitrosomonas sp.]MXS77851.1 flagellar hook protein FlgE [Nitrosomonas sp. JL21]